MLGVYMCEVIIHREKVLEIQILKSPELRVLDLELEGTLEIKLLPQHQSHLGSGYKCRITASETNNSKISQGMEGMLKF
jgi:hypothetical protein